MSVAWSAAMDSRFAGLDYLRIFAMVLVTIQHALSVSNAYEMTSFAGISLGQVGVGIFCAISGFLAFRSDSLPPGLWLRKRLTGLFPAYWLAMLFSFAVTWATAAKPFDAAQFVSQMLGIGYFTHGWQLVNIASWFISLILLCYTLAFLAKLSTHPRTLLIVFCAAAVALLSTHREVDLSRHILTFCLAGCAATFANNYRAAALAAAGGILLAVALASLQFAYAGFSLCLLALALGLALASRPAASTTAGYTYEYFLLHGIFLVGAARFVPGPALAKVAIGVGCSVIAAVMLKQVTRAITQRFSTPSNGLSA